MPKKTPKCLIKKKKKTPKWGGERVIMFKDRMDYIIQ